MSTTTSRLGLYEPADDGSEPINVATDLNDNLEKIDASIGFVPSTSAIPPASPFNGMATYETDTGVAKFRKAASSTWAQLLAAGSTFASNILMSMASRIGIGTASPSAVIDVIASSVFSQPFAKFRSNGETTHRLQIDHDGVRIGGGSTTPDIRLYRAAPGQLNLTSVTTTNEGALTVTGATSLSSLSVSGTVNLGGNIVTDLNVVGNIFATGTGFTKVIRKTVDEPRTNTTTAAVDPELYVDLEANTTYLLELYLFVSGLAAADIKTSWNIPASTTFYRWSLGPDTSAVGNSNVTMRSAIHLATSEPGYGLNTDTSWVGIKETCMVYLGATAGRVQFKFAQNTANATPTIVKSYSFMKVTKVA
jgi:hypothetical protein